MPHCCNVAVDARRSSTSSYSSHPIFFVTISPFCEPPPTPQVCIWKLLTGHPDPSGWGKEPPSKPMVQTKSRSSLHSLYKAVSSIFFFMCRARFSPAVSPCSLFPKRDLDNRSVLGLVWNLHAETQSKYPTLTNKLSRKTNPTSRCVGFDVAVHGSHCKFLWKAGTRHTTCTCFHAPRKMLGQMTSKTDEGNAQLSQHQLFAISGWAAHLCHMAVTLNREPHDVVHNTINLRSSSQGSCSQFVAIL